MTDANDATLSISSFAAASRLSLKALRVYERLGLLCPARVDETNGYRYYSPAQLPAAHLISLLRQLDLPLVDIQAILDAPGEQRPDLVRARWAAVKAEQERRDALARYVVHHLQGDTSMKHLFNVQTRFVAARNLACLTRRVTVDDLPNAISDGFRELHDFISAQQAGFAGPPSVLYHGEVNADSDGPIEVCWPYTGTLTPTGGITLRLEPAHHEAFVALTRAGFEFPDILNAYDATADYAGAHGTGGPLPCREVYPYDWDRAAPDEFAGEVAWPYTPRESES